MPKQNKIRNRVKELRTVRVSELLEHPRNWRIHPDHQRSAMQIILQRVGIADALVCYEREKDNALVILDGHLRREELLAANKDATVPVLILDVNDQEAESVLATHDAIGHMALPDEAGLLAILTDIRDNMPEMDGVYESIKDGLNLFDMEQLPTDLGDMNIIGEQKPESPVIVLNFDDIKGVHDFLALAGEKKETTRTLHGEHILDMLKRSKEEQAPQLPKNDECKKSKRPCKK